MLNPPERSKLSAQIFDALAAHILQEDLQPGDTLPSIGDLSAQFGTSRPVVREALSALEAIGLVDVNAGKNSTVRGVDSHLVSLFLTHALRSQSLPMTALMEIRAPLEVQCAGLASLRCEPEDRALIQRSLDDMTAQHDNGETYPLLDIAFHSAIAQATKNTALMLVTDALRIQLTEVMFRVRAYRESRSILGVEHDDHRDIAQAIIDGEPSAAREAMSAHMQRSIELVAALEEQPGTREESTTRRAP